MKSIIAIIACALLLGSCKPDSPEEKSASLLSEVSTEVLPDRNNIRVTLEKAQAGDAEGAWELGALFHLLATHMHIPHEEGMKLSLYWMQKAADGGCPMAMIDMGVFVLEPATEEISEEQAEAYAAEGVRLLEAAVRDGKAEAIHYQYLSNCCLSGIGTSQDLSRAREYFRQSLDALPELNAAEKQKAMERWETKAQRSMPQL